MFVMVVRLAMEYLVVVVKKEQTKHMAVEPAVDAFYGVYFHYGDYYKKQLN